VDDWDAESARLAARALADGRPTAWFEELYAAGAREEITMPWDRTRPSALLADWLTGSGTGRSAVVVGCGLGADAEFVAAHGFATTAFDISATAVRTARQRYPTSPVDYRTADLFALPDGWAFDLVAFTRAEIDSFAEHGLDPVAIEQVDDGIPRWRAEFLRSAP